VTILLDKRARAVIEREAVKRRLFETGGSIFGWTDADNVVVACASGPGPKAKHRPRTFEPAPGTTRAAMNRVEEASAGRYGYLGSWHTHPLGTPKPSGIDVGTAKAMAEQDDLLLPEPLLLILSTTGTRRRVEPAELLTWRWDASHRRLRQVTLEDCTLPERHCPPAELIFAS
jgi:integrative and conjugative element protein (TIGR02256 family)